MTFEQAVNIYIKQPEELDKLAELLSFEMTAEEKLIFLAGDSGGFNPLSLFNKGKNKKPLASFGGCKRLGVPAVLPFDRGTCFPSQLCRGASFDPAFERKLGEAMAKEAVAAGANIYCHINSATVQAESGVTYESFGETEQQVEAMAASLTAELSENGVLPCVGVSENRSLVTDGEAVSSISAVLCDETEPPCDGFDGFVIPSGTFKQKDAAGVLKGGFDCVPLGSVSRLKKQFYEGRITEYDINLRIRRILRAMLKAYSIRAKMPREVVSPEAHRLLAKHSAQRGTVLLKNRYETLPIRKYKKIAVVGLGNTNLAKGQTLTPYRAITELLGFESVVLYEGLEPNGAAQAARDCDYIVVCIKEGTEAEVELINSISRLGGRSVVCVFGGAANVARWITKADAVLMSFGGGCEYGRALADILVGNFNPSAGLPCSLPMESETVGKKNDLSLGFGLSYTSFTLEPIVAVRQEDKVVVSCLLSNHGNYRGATVVQVYVSFGADGEADAEKQLVAFSRVEMRVGEIKTVTMNVDVKLLKRYLAQWGVTEGYCRVYYGKSRQSAVAIGKIPLNEL